MLRDVAIDKIVLETETEDAKLLLIAQRGIQHQVKRHDIRYKNRHFTDKPALIRGSTDKICILI